MGRANPMIYEIMSIIPPKFSDSEIDGVVTKIEALYTAAGATVKKTSNLGKIKLAYPIDKVRYGTYILTYVDVAGEKVAKIDQDLRLSEDVLRHIIIVRPEGIPATVFKMTSYQPPLNAEGRRAGEREDAPRPRTERVAEAVVEKAKMSTAELNDKLDQILDSDILKNI
jgi:small subunit ribosomal protein S6